MEKKEREKEVMQIVTMIKDNLFKDWKADVSPLLEFIEQELDKAREEGNEELSEAMIKYLENMIVLVGAFNPMSEVIKARQEGELEAYKEILSKLKDNK